MSRTLRALRLERGLTLSALAKRSGVARSYLYQLEAHTSSPTLDVVELLCRGLDMSILEFIEAIYYTKDEPPFPLAV